MTPRQQQVHALLRRGMSNKQIGRALGIAEATVKVHMTGVLATFGVRTRLEASMREA